MSNVPLLQVRLAWSGQLPSQVWSCLAQQLANEDDTQMAAGDNDNEVTKLKTELDELGPVTVRRRRREMEKPES